MRGARAPSSFSAAASNVARSTSRGARAPSSFSAAASNVARSTSRGAARPDPGGRPLVSAVASLRARRRGEARASSSGGILGRRAVASMDADPAHDPPATAPDAPRRACVRAHVASESDPGAAALVRGAVAAPASPDVLILPASVPLPEGVDANASEFDPARYFAELRASALGRVLLTARVLPSTQTLVSDNTAAAPGEVIPRGALVVADSQTGGRGRGGNAWTSPPGCLTFSLLARHAEGRTLPFLQYVATMAAVEAIQDAARVSFPAPRRSGKASASADASVLDVRVKWPNDLYSGGQKIGGVLCASTYADGAFDVVVGVGINLDNPAPTTCVNHIIEAARRDRGVDADAVPFAPVTREALAARFATRFEALARVVAETRGFDAIEAAYLNMWMHTGQEVTLIEEGEEGGEGREVRLRIEGLTRDGYLLAKDGGGGRFELHPDGNSLDFFKGLVRKKLPSR